MAVYQRRYTDGRKSKDWYVAWYVGGKQFKKKIGPNKRAATLFANDIELKRVRGELLGISEQKRILFGDLADKYSEWAKGRKSPARLQDEGYIVARLKESFTVLASKVSRADLDGYFSKRLETVGAARFNIELQVVRAIFRKGVEWHYCRKNPADGIKRMKEPPGRVRFLSEEERAALLKACPDRLRQIVEIDLDTGLRRGELLGLRWADVDLKGRLLRVERSKNGDRRDIPMSGRVFEILQAIPRRLDTPFVFTHVHGDPWRHLARDWYAALKDAKLEGFHFHDLRHTFASNLVMAGVDIRTVQTLMGHRNITMTMRYAHLSPAHLRDAISKLSGATPRTKQEHAESGK